MALFSKKFRARIQAGYHRLLHRFAQKSPVPPPLKIVTFGSCLSKYIFEALQRSGLPAEREGSVYHNRIDIFVDSYVSNLRPPPPQHLLDALQFAPATAAENAAILRNQLSGVGNTLGFHLSAQKPGFFSALSSADVVLLDNFVDVAAQAAECLQGQARLFANFKGITNFSDHLRNIGVLEPATGLIKWQALVSWIREQNPTAHIIFTQFPCAHHRNEQIRKRGAEWGTVMARLTGVLYLPGEVVQDSELQPDSQAHFIPAVYDRYVARIREYIGRP